MVCNAGAMVQVIGGSLVDFWGLWCQITAETGCIGYAVVMVVGDGGYSDLAKVWGNVVVWWRSWRWVGVEVLLP
jgi:hypothetical protein